MERKSVISNSDSEADGHAASSQESGSSESEDEAVLAEQRSEALAHAVRVLERQKPLPGSRTPAPLAQLRFCDANGAPLFQLPLAPGFTLVGRAASQFGFADCPVEGVSSHHALLELAVVSGGAGSSVPGRVDASPQIESNPANANASNPSNPPPHATPSNTLKNVAVFVEDLYSTNRTSLGADAMFELTPRKSYQLLHGDIVSFGPVNCVFEVLGIPALPQQNIPTTAEAASQTSAIAPTQLVLTPSLDQTQRNRNLDPSLNSIMRDVSPAASTPDPTLNPTMREISPTASTPDLPHASPTPSTPEPPTKVNLRDVSPAVPNPILRDVSPASSNSAPLPPGQIQTLIVCTPVVDPTLEAPPDSGDNAHNEESPVPQQPAEPDMMMAATLPNDDFDMDEVSDEDGGQGNGSNSAPPPVNENINSPDAASAAPWVNAETQYMVDFEDADMMDEDEEVTSQIPLAEIKERLVQQAKESEDESMERDGEQERLASASVPPPSEQVSSAMPVDAFSALTADSSSKDPATAVRKSQVQDNQQVEEREDSPMLDPPAVVDALPVEQIEPAVAPASPLALANDEADHDSDATTANNDPEPMSPTAAIAAASPQLIHDAPPISPTNERADINDAEADTDEEMGEPVAAAAVADVSFAEGDSIVEATAPEFSPVRRIVTGRAATVHRTPRFAGGGSSSAVAAPTRLSESPELSLPTSSLSSSKKKGKASVATPIQHHNTPKESQDSVLSGGGGRSRRKAAANAESKMHAIRENELVPLAQAPVATVDAMAAAVMFEDEPGSSPVLLHSVGFATPAPSSKHRVPPSSTTSKPHLNNTAAPPTSSNGGPSTPSLLSPLDPTSKPTHADLFDSSPSDDAKSPPGVTVADTTSSASPTSPPAIPVIKQSPNENLPLTTNTAKKGRGRSRSTASTLQDPIHPPDAVELDEPSPASAAKPTTYTRKSATFTVQKSKRKPTTISHEAGLSPAVARGAQEQDDIGLVVPHSAGSSSSGPHLTRHASSFHDPDNMEDNAIPPKPATSKKRKTGKEKSVSVVEEAELDSDDGRLVKSGSSRKSVALKRDVGGSSISEGSVKRGRKKSGVAGLDAIAAQNGAMEHVDEKKGSGGAASEFFVTFTGLEDVEKQTLIVLSLGGTCVDSWAECTHVVTDKVRRTVKFLSALAAGKHLVSIKWLDQCKKEGRFVDESKFIIKDKPNETKFGFSLSASIGLAARGTRFLAGYTIYTTANVKPNRVDMKEIIDAAGGTVMLFVFFVFHFVTKHPFQLVESLPKPATSPHLIIIGCDDDAAECVALMGKGLTVHTNEFILTGCLQQRVDMGAHVWKKEGAGASVVVKTEKRKK
ncbi:Mediator of DNA damage checkpoint protein 1 [Podochytrium sp. JEL0797]|nr:Mediator of DNA damage checkpoint protein 1 [Podochytrium sp. JEL0797]